MPRVIHVKKARKPNSVISQEAIDKANNGTSEDDKSAASYYHWTFKTGPRSSLKKFSKTRPKPSQLTLSPFLSVLYELQENVTDGAWSFDSLESQIEETASCLRELSEEAMQSFENMPEGLQQGDTGQLLEERADCCESAADELESLDPNSEEYDGNPDDENAIEVWRADKAEEIHQNAIEILDNIGQ